MSMIMRQVTKLLGVSARTIRFYEDEGLISPKRSPHSQQVRVYSETDIGRLRTILHMRAMQFSIVQIKHYFEQVVGKAKETHTLLADQLTRLADKKADLDLAVVKLNNALENPDNPL